LRLAQVEGWAEPFDIRDIHVSEQTPFSDAVMPTYGRIALTIERGEGPYVFTPDGQRYLDFGSGIAVNAMGHAHPHLIDALSDQAHKLWHVSNLYQIPGQQRLAARLCAASFAEVVFFCNSGAEAVEASVKCARKYAAATGRPERYRMITFENAFHGRTLGMIAAGKQAKHVEGFGPLMDGFDQVPLGDLAAVQSAITDETAGILLEPVQGEGGIHVVPFEFMRALRRVCDERGLMLVLDEVQTGMGRTGKMFAYEWADITPDILATAKGIGGGFPLGACLATREAAVGMTAGSHGSTFGGNPLAMAVGNAVMDILLAPGFLEHVQKLSLDLKQSLARLCDQYPDIIENVRGLGLLIGLKCKTPNLELVNELLEERVLCVGAGDNVVRLIPPLTIEAEHIHEAVEALDRACQKLSRQSLSR